MSVSAPKVFLASNRLHEMILDIERDACSEFPPDAWDRVRYIQDASLEYGYLPLVVFERDQWDALAVAWGCFHFHPSRSAIRITRLATRWSHRRQGLAKLLIREAISYGQKKLRTQFEQLEAVVVGDNVGGENFFHRLKFGYDMVRTADGSIVTRFKRGI